MTEIELMRHVLANAEAGKPAGNDLQEWYGLPEGWVDDPAEHAYEINWICPEDFRVSPRTHTINGWEVPEPVQKVPSKGAQYWFESPCDRNWCRMNEWKNMSTDLYRLNRGLIHSTPEAARASCRARYGYEPYGEDKA